MFPEARQMTKVEQVVWPETWSWTPYQAYGNIPGQMWPTLSDLCSCWSMIPLQAFFMIMLCQTSAFALCMRMLCQSAIVQA